MNPEPYVPRPPKFTVLGQPRTTVESDGTIIRRHPETGTPFPPPIHEQMEDAPIPEGAFTDPQFLHQAADEAGDIDPGAFEGEVEINRLPRRPRPGMFGRQRQAESGILVVPDERDVFENLILFPEVENDVNDGLRLISNRQQLEDVWHISRLVPIAGRVVLSMYGPSGTGKTRVARAIAKKLGKNLYQVDYSTIVSKYLGDTAKHIVLAFKRAKQLGAVLFFDEGDSLMSRRVDMGESCATSINQNRNTLMQELDRFDAPVIVTTNLFGNYDPAFIRRIAKHIKFDMPNQEMRKKIFILHIPNMDRVDADLDLIASASDSLAGGDIFNVCLNTILASSNDPNPVNWRMKQETFLAEIQKVKSARVNNSTSRASRVGNGSR